MTRRRRRILRGVMWGCVGFGVLSAAAWVWSGVYWLDCGYATPARFVEFSVSHAGIGGEWLEPGNRTGTPGFAFSGKLGTWTTIMRVKNPDWRGKWVFRADSSGWIVRVPLWLPCLAGIAVALLICRSTRKGPSGLCPRCGYDLAGSPSSVCPECGAAGEPKGEG